MTSDVIPDTGRQYERTEMAWVRSALLLAGLGALLVRDPPSGWRGPVVFVAASLAVVAGGGVVTGRCLALSRHPRPARAARWQTGALAAAVVLLGLASLLLVP